MREVVNVNQLLDGHVSLEIECLDRIYLNAYVPNLQVGGNEDHRWPPGHVRKGMFTTTPGCVTVLRWA